MEDVENHTIHLEYYRIEEDAAQRINLAKSQGKKITCVGATSVRTVESAAVDGRLPKSLRETQIFIYPPYEFKIVVPLLQASIFRVPLIMLISAFSDREKDSPAHTGLLWKRYRFFSFGDAVTSIRKQE